MQFDWTVKRTAAASQQVQRGHSTAHAASTPATAANPTPGSHQSSGKASSKKTAKQPWHEAGKLEFSILPRYLENGVVGGQEVLEGQFVQVRNYVYQLCASKSGVRHELACLFCRTEMQAS